MKKSVFEIDVPDSGHIHFQKTLPQWGGKRIKLFLLAIDNDELTSYDLEKAIDEDWSDWNDSREDIYEEYRKYLPER